MARNRKLFRPKLVVEGMDTLAMKLARLQREISGNLLRETVLEASEPVAEDVSANAPMLTGNLSENIETEVTIENRTKAQVAIGPGKSAFYGMFQELGTVHMPAQPFLRPAFDANKDQVIEDVGDILRRRILEVARR